MKITEEMKKVYLGSGGGSCPFCKSDDVEGDRDLQTDMDYASHNMHCHACCRDWVDVYTLTDIAEAEG